MAGLIPFHYRVCLKCVQNNPILKATERGKCHLCAGTSDKHKHPIPK